MSNSIQLSAAINATVDSDVELVLMSGMSVSGKYFKRRLFNMADEDTERRWT